MKEKPIAESLHLWASACCYKVMDHALLERDIEHLPKRKFRRYFL